MADPFSIIVGTAGLADVCIRLAQFLKQAKDGFQKVDEELEDLFEEVARLRSVNDLVERSYVADAASSSYPGDQDFVVKHWEATRTTLAGCQSIVEQIESLLVGVLRIGNGKHVKLDKLRKYLEKQSKDEAFNKLRQKLNAHQAALQTCLAAVNVIYTRNSQATSNESSSELSRSIQDLGADLQSKITYLQTAIELSAERTLDNAVQSAQKVVPLASLNRHFYTPQTVSSIYTGRNSELSTLNEHLKALTLTKSFQVQKRFVVFGLSGSGKTQFCCKFASDNKQSFWGIFWIDASSEEHAKQSFSTIAMVGKVAPNQRAAKNWLSSLGQEQPWLLIIDNADEANFPVEESFPDGNGGTILVTTRNPMLKVHGTVGPRYYHFDELEEPESIELLLRAADEPMPWSPSTISSAQVISRTLGYLPLALMHAGKTILAHLCTLETYLDFFERNWLRIRQIRRSNDANSISDANAAIYSSYELIHEKVLSRNTQVSKDALDLLKIFSFLHRQRIRVDIFMRAASSPKAEALEQQRKEKAEKKLGNQPRPKVTWAQTFKNSGIGIYTLLLQLGHRPALPRFLGDTLGSGPFDEVRLRQALKELFQLSLVFKNSELKDDTYSMHPAVHLWVRERPEMTLAEQAVWCQVTANILSRAILLPPLGDKEEDEIFRRDLLPHVNHVQHNEQIIRAKYLENQESRRRIWPVLQSRLDRNRAMQLVKFSLVLSQGGLLEEAEKIQSHVAGFAVKNLGIEHTATMDIMLLLSSTYWQLARGEEAADLQKQVLEACIKVRGKEDLKTLKVMDAYGSSRWQQGRIPEARKFHQIAVEGLRKVLGDDHADTLRATGNLGRAVGKDFEFTEAVKIHSKVYTGLRTELGTSHLDTLIAKDNLAMAYYDRAAYGQGYPGDLDNAVRLEQEVFATRKEKLGREHLYTLWAGLNLSRIRAARGEIDQALSTFLPGHAIARRNLGETHFGVLFGKMHHGRILISAGRYREAEDILLEVVDSHEGSRKGHPDRLLAMASLITCRNLLGRERETTALLEELTESTKALFGPDHAAVKYLLDPRNLSKGLGDVVNRPVDLIDFESASVGSMESRPAAVVTEYETEGACSSGSKGSI